jgi:fructose-1,6-bisphosphatase II
MQDLNELLNLFSQITQFSAVSAYSLFGKNDKHTADKLAVDAMRESLNKLSFQTRVIIGEGEKDKAPMLYENEILGLGESKFDLAVDPLECTTNFSLGLPNSMSILAFTEKDKMQRVPGTYMEQWFAGPKMKKSFHLENSIKENILLLVESLNKDLNDIRVVTQDRPRHTQLIKELRDLNVSISLIDSGSISVALDIALEKGNYDAMIGTFGAPEGIIAGIIAKSTDSEFKARLKPHTLETQQKWIELGRKESDILDKEDILSGSLFGFVGTGISYNSILTGIQKKEKKYSGQSLLLTKNICNIKNFEVEYGT